MAFFSSRRSPTNVLEVCYSEVAHDHDDFVKLVSLDVHYHPGFKPVIMMGYRSTTHGFSISCLKEIDVTQLDAVSLEALRSLLRELKYQKCPVWEWAPKEAQTFSLCT